MLRFMNIRPFQIDDIGCLDFTLNLRTDASTRVKHPDWSSREGLRSDAGFFTRRGHGFGLVAESDGDIVGFVGCAGPMSERTAIRLHGPVVVSTSRRGGIGRALLEQALEGAREQYPEGCNVAMWAGGENVAAGGLLNDFGFDTSYTEWFMRCDDVGDLKHAPPEGCRVSVVRNRAGVERAYGIYIATWSGKKSIDSFHADISSSPNGMYLLENRSGALAFFVLMARSNGNADIEYFAVRPDVRRMGYGSMLMRHALPMIRDEVGGRPVILTVHTDNEPAIRLYEGAGFRKLYAMDCWQLNL
jgi:ribosomal protein S18 acetylase RimI-like enzyme